MTGYSVLPVTGVGEVRAGDDLAALLAGATDLRDGDVLVVTSKVVSKAEDRVVGGTKEDAVAAETARVVARRGGTSIVRHHLGLVMAAAGVDASNTAPGTVVLLPLDPDASARALRARLHEETGLNVAVLVTDTAGRAWRTGQTDLAIGCAGLDPLDDHAGRVDSYGNALAVTAPAVVDEVAGLAELVTGKLGGRPVSVVRGLGDRVLPAGTHGPGAASLVRARSEDMFALGAREAVLAAVRGTDHDCFGQPAPLEDAEEALRSCGLAAEPTGGSLRIALPDEQRDRVVAAERVRLVAHAIGWRPHSDLTVADSLTISPFPASGRP
ncbi:MAG: coenzyme F420-0:L-glutamate ligase [Marmoricola sp.]|nr:coenzyme F420-0:L-glutamate ligase [Marmoricola sp.]